MPIYAQRPAWVSSVAPSMKVFIPSRQPSVAICRWLLSRFPSSPTSLQQAQLDTSHGTYILYYVPTVGGMANVRACAVLWCYRRHRKLLKAALTETPHGRNRIEKVLWSIVESGVVYVVVWVRVPLSKLPLRHSSVFDTTQR